MVKCSKTGRGRRAGVRDGGFRVQGFKGSGFKVQGFILILRLHLGCIFMRKASALSGRIHPCIRIGKTHSVKLYDGVSDRI